MALPADAVATGRGPRARKGGSGVDQARSMADSFVLHYTGPMARPRGCSKPARLTINLDRPTYVSLVEIAEREDVSVSWVVWRAIEALLAEDRIQPVGPKVAPSTDERDRAHSGEKPPP